MTQAKNALRPQDEIWVLIATILASSMVFIDSTALNVALPAIQNDLNASGIELLWILNIYTVFLASLILVGGSLGDHYGRVRIFRYGILIFTAASIVCGLSVSPVMLIIARAVQGIGGALMVPGSLAIISALFPAEKRGTAIGTWSTFSTLTTVMGPVLGGWLAQQGLWRVVFFINLPLALLALYTLTRVPENKDEDAPQRLDYLGAFLATLGLAGVSFGFIQGAEWGLSDPRIVVALVVGVINLIAFIINERRSDHPMMPLSLFQNRTFFGANLLTLFLYGALYGSLFFLPLNLIQVQGYSESVAGWANIPSSIILALLSRFSGGLVDRIGARLPLIIGPAIAGVGFILLALPGLTEGQSAYWTTYFPGIVAFGIGMGITVAPLSTAVMGSAPQAQSGTASGINNAISRVAGALAIAIFGLIAVSIFTNAISSRVESVALDAETQTAVVEQAQDLAGAEPPASVPEAQIEEINQVYDLAFVDTFRLIMGIAAGMAFISAIMAAILIQGKEKIRTT